MLKQRTQIKEPVDVSNVWNCLKQSILHICQK